MAFTFSTTLNETDFNTQAFNFLKNVEGAETGVYLDSKNIPTIGIGFNMTGSAIQVAVFKALGFSVDDGNPPVLNLTLPEQGTLGVRTLGVRSCLANFN